MEISSNDLRIGTILAYFFEKFRNFIVFLIQLWKFHQELPKNKHTLTRNFARHIWEKQFI